MAGEAPGGAAGVVLDRGPDVCFSRLRIPSDAVFSHDHRQQPSTRVLLPLPTLLVRNRIICMGGLPFFLRSPALRRIGTPAHHPRWRASPGVSTLDGDEAASPLAGGRRNHTSSAARRPDSTPHNWQQPASSPLRRGGGDGSPQTL